MRKYDAATVTVDLSLLPNKNSLVQQAGIFMRKLFCEEGESLSNSSHSEEESPETLEDKSLTLCEKLGKTIHAKALCCSTRKSSSFSKIVKQELQLSDSTNSKEITKFYKTG
ncbi:hypothetical protein AVEN_167422-1 [Araneus ventricosus]|uniref:Uncharacterized protein n=1 Tax=Araneus ventricosus TaxID=182803 RepID=A0A4Y2K6T1_ARAVE|nr:hypothetical protein AVEN_167422-1 [Araneus ventricosus]